MAVQSLSRNSQIVLRVSLGQNFFRYLRINNIKNTASDEDVYAVAIALAGLQKYPLVNVFRADNKELVEL
jgi:hypothetical protein